MSNKKVSMDSREGMIDDFTNASETGDEKTMHMLTDNEKKAFDDASNLTKLGSGKTEYKFNEPCAEMLETFDNRFPHRDYVVVYRTDELTSLCPRTGQPDFGMITIEYIPNKKCIETKSLKLYLFAYRNYGIFMESLANKVLEDCVKVCNPKWMRVICNFKARGGITIDVAAEHGRLPLGMPLGMMNANEQQK